MRTFAMAVLACGLVACTSYAAAQTSVCSNTPSTGERVACTEDSTSTDDIDILLEGIDIDVVDATETNTHAVSAKHGGTGDIDIDVTHSTDESSQVVRSTIDTSGVNQAFAIYGEHSGTGTVDISVSTTTIGTTGPTAHGVHGYHTGSGRILLDVSDSRIDTKGQDSHGIYADHTSTDTSPGTDARVSVTATSNEIVTEGQEAHGIRGASEGLGNVTVTSMSNTVTTKGFSAHGIYGYHRGEGDIDIVSQDDAITTEASSDFDGAMGIFGWHQLGNGDVDIDVTGGTIKTKGLLSTGINAVHGNLDYSPVSTEGEIEIDVGNTIIETTGKYGYGIWGIHTGSGGIDILTRGSQRIATTGQEGHGIVAYHTGSGEDRSVDITVGGTIDAQGTGADGVRVGRVSSGNADRAAAFDEDGYRKHTVRVNGSIDSATGAGVFLAGGGKVFIGPSGSIDTDSGIAILATGDTPGDNPEDPAIKPKLFVGMQLDGRRVAAVLGNGWIINDGGETTISVNDVKLHDGATGAVTGAVAANGAWDVTIREAGVKVTDRTDADPANWTVSDPATGIVADRDFSTADFIQTSATCPEGQVGTPPDCHAPLLIIEPPEPDPSPFENFFSCPPGQVGTPPNCTALQRQVCPPGQVGTPPDCSAPPPPTGPVGQVGTPPDCSVLQQEACPPGKVGTPPDCSAPQPGPEIVETLSPRAAVYEALPGFLLRLNAPDSHGMRANSQEPVIRARFSGARGAFEPERARVGAWYSFGRRSLEAGLELPLGDGIAGLASIRSMQGTAHVSAMTGGGRVEANGLGAAIGLSVNGGTSGLYARGGLSGADYELDFVSDVRGALKTGVSARGCFLYLEAGQRMRLDDRMFVMPRIGATSAKVDVDGFTDAADARVSVLDASRRKGTIGFIAGIEQRPDGSGEVPDLWGSLDLERTFDGTGTRVRVSGEELFSVAQRTRLNLALGGSWRGNGLVVDMAVSALGPGSDDSQYSAHVALKMRF